MIGLLLVRRQAITRVGRVSVVRKKIMNFHYGSAVVSGITPHAHKSSVIAIPRRTIERNTVRMKILTSIL